LRARWLAAALLFGLAVAPSLSAKRKHAPAGSAAPGIGHIDRQRLAECSGLVQSRRHPGVFWSLSDSGDTNRIFALRADGKILREVRIQGAQNIDWEEISTDDAGFLYISDSGNNRNARRDLVIYRVAEPDPAKGPEQIPVSARLAFRYPDQHGYPQANALNFDAEALFWARGRLYILTKHRSDSRTTLYRFPTSAGTEEVELEKLGTVDVGESGRPFGGMVTAASVTPDGRTLAVLTYNSVLLFQRPEDSDDYLSRPLKRIDLDSGAVKQCEGIAWDGKTLLVANEQGEIHRLDAPLAASCVRYPGCR
jgi:hypothetical protein